MAKTSFVVRKNLPTFLEKTLEINRFQKALVESIWATCILHGRVFPSRVGPSGSNNPSEHSSFLNQSDTVSIQNRISLHEIKKRTLEIPLHTSARNILWILVHSRDPKLSDVSKKDREIADAILDAGQKRARYECVA